mmetsp:Transcript_19467/g.54117  ORF Transcript_19467/g.54117 Transcript_19467/m.54117 type:complete len:284 (+) Transcript_19467:21-872(+)
MCRVWYNVCLSGRGAAVQVRYHLVPLLERVAEHFGQGRHVIKYHVIWEWIIFDEPLDDWLSLDEGDFLHVQDVVLLLLPILIIAFDYDHGQEDVAFQHLADESFQLNSAVSFDPSIADEEDELHGCIFSWHVEGIYRPLHAKRCAGALLVKLEVPDSFHAALGCEGQVERMDELHLIAETGNAKLANFKLIHADSKRRHGTQRHVSRSALQHAFRIIHCHEHTVVPFRWFGASQPDLVLAVPAGDVTDDTLHVDPLPGPVISSQLGRNQWLHHEPQFLAQATR